MLLSVRPLESRARGPEFRARLADARLLLVFTPSVTDDPWGALEAALPHVDVVQVRVKNAPDAVTEARATYDAALRVLEMAADADCLVMVNDRVDVARALLPAGLAGVHLGEDDCPAVVARGHLGPDALIGLSTHDARGVANAFDEPVDCLGFGPCFPTTTKGYERGLGPEAAWAASQAANVPLFPIGGIDTTNAFELAQVGRAAVASSILAARDPADAARAIRSALEI